MNLVDGTTTLDGEPITFHFGQELSAWLRERAEADGLGWSNLSLALMQVRFDFDEATTLGRLRWWQTRASVQESRRELSFACEASIESAAGSASSRRSARALGDRKANGSWMVR
jgi:hypothetical protein